MSTNNSSSIAFLPVDNTQKNSFNFKELNKLLHEMVSIASKSIIEIESSDLNEESIQDSIIKAIETVYHKQDEKKVKAKRPKQALTSYILFCNANRTKVKEENTELDPKDLTRKLAELWGNLSEEEKQPYVEESKREAERLKRESESGKEDSEDEVKNVKAKPVEKAEKKEAKTETKKSSEKPKAVPVVEKVTEEPKKGKAVKKSEVKAPTIQMDEEEPMLTEEPVKKGKTSKK